MAASGRIEAPAAYRGTSLYTAVLPKSSLKYSPRLHIFGYISSYCEIIRACHRIFKVFAEHRIFSMSTSIPGLYRSLLRQFKLYPTLSNRNSRLRSDLRNKFRNKENVLNPAENQLERIELYHNLLKSVQQGTVRVKDTQLIDHKGSPRAKFGRAFFSVRTHYQKRKESGS